MVVGLGVGPMVGDAEGEGEEGEELADAVLQHRLHLHHRKPCHQHPRGVGRRLCHELDLPAASLPQP